VSCYIYSASSTPIRVALGFFFSLGGQLLVGRVRI